MLVSGGFMAQGLGAVTGLVIARRVGPSGYGEYAAAFAFVNAFVFTFLFGLDSVVVREVAKHPERAGKIISSAWIPAIIWSGGLVLLIYIVALGLDYSADGLALVSILSPAIAFKGMINLARAGFRGLERLDLDVILQTFEAVLALTFVVMLFGRYTSTYNAAWGFFLGELTAFCLATILIIRLTGPISYFNIENAKRLIRDALPIGLTFTLVGFNSRLDMIVLGIFSTKTEIGIYAAALGIVTLSRSWSLVSAALLPQLAMAFNRNMKTFFPLFKKGLWSSVILGSIIGFFIILLSEPIMSFFFGKDFIHRADILKILGMMSTILFINTYLWQTMIAMNLQGQLASGVCLSMLITIGLLFSFVPKYGIFGGAVAILGREVCQIIALSWLIFGKLSPR